MDISKAKLGELRALLDEKKISAPELCAEYIGRIKGDGSRAFITVCEETALAAARDAQKSIDEKKALPLTGIPIAVKDNICTADARTTCASKMLESFVPPYDATVITALREQGAVIIGKTNMDEFAMGGSSQTSYFGGVKNPVDPERVPGGSSGGSAAAVAAGLAPAALGSDTGGSVRQPASFCGITGLKPTYGAVSRYGLIAFGSSLDQIGMLAHSAEDCGILFDAVCRYDEFDGSMSRHSVDALSRINDDKILSGRKIGLPAEFFGEGIDPEVARLVTAAAAEYEKLGCELISVSLPSLKYAVPAYYLLSSAEASSNLARYDGVKFGYRSQKGETYAEIVGNTRAEGFGAEVKRRIMLGNYALCSGYYDAYYGQAMRIRAQLSAEYEQIFSRCDFIITPTAPTTAYKIGENESDPVRMYMADICTVTANIAYLPAISTPCGRDSKGLPVGMSLVGKRFDEALLIAACAAYERGISR